MDEILIELPELGLSTSLRGREPERVPLAARQLKSGDEAHDVRSRVLIGPPDVALMRPRADEDPSVTDRREGFDFWSVLMTLSFVPEDPEAFAAAWLRVDLSADAPAQAPVAFSMSPNLKEETVAVENSVGITGGPPVLKVSGSTKWGYGVHEAEVTAFNRGRPDPAWELAPSTGRELRGGRDLLLVVKAPKRGRGRGRVAFGANVEWEESKLFGRRRQDVTWRGEEASFELVAP